MVILPPDTGSSSLLEVARHREGGPPHRPRDMQLQIGGACESSENTRTEGGAGRRDYVLPTAYSTRPCDRLDGGRGRGRAARRRPRPGRREARRRRMTTPAAPITASRRYLTSPDLATPWLLQGTLRVRPARPPGPGTVPLDRTCGGCGALVENIPLRAVAVVGSIGFTGWVGRIVGCSVAPGVCEQRDGAVGNALHGTSGGAGATGARRRVSVRQAG